jgi:type I restriction enzyme M protein
LQHFIRLLRAGGRAGVVIKNTFLSNTDNASVALRLKLLTDCNLHTVLDCPGGTFQGAGVKTVVLFFETLFSCEHQVCRFFFKDTHQHAALSNPLASQLLQALVTLN